MVRRTSFTGWCARVLLGLALLGAVPPAAQANRNLNAGISLVVSLGPTDDRARFGLGLDATAQWFDHRGPYRNPEPQHLALLSTAGVHLTWVRPHVALSATGAVGAMYPWQVYDSGFVSGAGLQAQGGLSLSTDGTAGPVLGVVAVAPYSEVRLESTWAGGWHAPRLAIAPHFTVSGYGTFL